MTGTPATTTLRREGVPFTPHTYDHDPSAASFGLEAAQALGVDPARVFKTLLVTLDTGAFAVAVVPVSRSLDLKAVAAALGAKKASMTDAAAAERSSGYVRGGISPLGQRKRLPTVVDETAFSHATVLVSGGRRGFDLELAAEDLARLTDAVRAAIGR